MAEEQKYLKSISVAERQIYILSLLSENPQGFRIDDIVEKLAGWDVPVKRRTIQRDIDELSLSYGISEEERGGETYYTADKYNLKNVDLTISDLMSIAFMQELLENYRGLDVAEHSQQLLNRLTQNAGISKRAQLMDFHHIIRNMDANRSKNQDVDPQIEITLRNAMDQHKKLEITYYAWNRDEKTRRVIHPYSFVMNDGYLNVEAFCELRGEIRNFRVSRMSDVTMLNDSFQIDPSVSRPRKPFLHLSGGMEELLVLQFDSEKGRFVMEYEKSRADRVEKQPDGGCLFYKKTAVTDEVKQYVLGYGCHVKVLEPAWFAMEIRKEAETLAECYKEET